MSTVLRVEQIRLLRRPPRHRCRSLGRGGVDRDARNESIRCASKRLLTPSPNSGDWAGAADAFRKAIFSPTLGYTRSSLELGCALLHLSRGAEAVAVLQPTLRSFTDGSNLYANRTELHEMLGAAWAAAGRPDSARAHYQIVASAWANGDPPFRARAQRASSALGGGPPIALPGRGCH